jgi:hypothetical protein
MLRFSGKFGGSSERSSLVGPVDIEIPSMAAELGALASAPRPPVAAKNRRRPKRGMSCCHSGVT